MHGRVVMTILWDPEQVTEVIAIKESANLSQSWERPGGSPQWGLKGPCTPGLMLLPPGPLLTFPSVCGPRNPPSSRRASQGLSLLYSGSLAESASFPTLPFVPTSRLLIYNPYIPALYVAGLQVPGGMKILTSVHAENLLLTPMLHFLKNAFTETWQDLYSFF